ncbi:radical SAM protein [Terasakiella sp. SH-1]|uniref:B12-binding domain-containing radical SAM protein n=1 Tax=Terasakiella sp. SH-1 TaxID=2560057 RepID=UPI00107420D3|nr:radical SAM protein [Terasakiella sp. SH-1]
MKIQLVKVSTPGDFKSYKAYVGRPPQNIFSIAAATPTQHQLELIDETANQKFKPKRTTDLVALFAATPDITRTYELANKLRKKNIPIVIGGLHASFLPDEALQYCDAVLVGEAEQSWNQLLNDFEAGQLENIYRATGDIDMNGLSPYPLDNLPVYEHNGSWSVLAARGCKFKCEYCTVHKFFPNYRHRPVEQVIDEIRQSKVDYLEIHADNLISDRQYALELFHALKDLNIAWTGEATLNIAEYDDILEVAAQSGLNYLVVGLESCSKAALKNAGKGFIKLDKAKEYVRKLHDYHIAVDSCMLFGFDEHDPTIFEETLNWVEEIELDVVHPNIMTPFPGTDLFARMEKEGRILTYDWSKYDCSHAVFRPKQMSPDELEAGVQWFYDKHTSWKRTLKRKANHVKNLGWEGASYL